MELSICAIVLSMPIGSTTATELSSAEASLVTLMNGYYDELSSFWKSGRKFDTSASYFAAIESGELVDPNAKYIPRLLEFEQRHRGEGVGLLALRHVFREAARGGPLDSPAPSGRRIAVQRLNSYVANDLLPTVAATAIRGNYDPEVDVALSELVRDESLPPRSRDQLSYTLASRALRLRDLQSKVELAVASPSRGDIDSGQAERLNQSNELLSLLPSREVLAVRCEEAIRTLEELAAKGDRLPIRKVKGIDSHARIVRLANDPNQPSVAERSAAILFQERNLRVGCELPDIKMTLSNGERWRLSDQRGKVVVLQLSFTGCGPCEQMYPDLAELSAEYGDKLAILTLMRDADSTAAHEAVASGKITWDIAVDGDPGRIATKWSVEEFPAVYVIDPVGIIAAKQIRGSELREEVERLLSDAE